MFIPCQTKPDNWNNYTVIVPAVSVGNVGQLAADLLISTMWMDKVGYFHDDSLLPVIGNDPFASSDISTECHLVTAAEVYESRNHKLVCVQQRAPFVKGKRRQFLQKLMNWIIENHFKKIVVLTSSFSHERLDQQLTGTQLRFKFSTDVEKEAGETVRHKLGWVELEQRRTLLSDSSDPATSSSDIFIPGGGIAKHLYQECIQQKLPVAVLLLFCSEGDNAADAIQLATYLNSWQSWVDLKKSADVLPRNQEHGWKIPSSWRLQFGSQFQPTLFQ